MSSIRFFDETFANISYSVLIGLVVALLLLVALVHQPVAVLVANFLIYAGSLNFVLTLLMILKRVHSLLGHEFDDGK
jgi:ethanolamine transporter EutH